MSDYRDVHKALAAQGWEVTRADARNFRARPPDKTRSIVYFTESNAPRAFDNAVRDLRRSGFVWPPAPTVPPSRAADGIADAVPTMLAGPSLLEPTGGGATSATKTVNQLFSELKEARLYAALADEDHRAAVSKLEDVQRAVESGARTKRMADESLARAKTAFDQAFEATS